MAHRAGLALITFAISALSGFDLGFIFYLNSASPRRNLSAHLIRRPARGSGLRHGYSRYPRVRRHSVRSIICRRRSLPAGRLGRRVA